MGLMFKEHRVDSFLKTDLELDNRVSEVLAKPLQSHGVPKSLHTPDCPFLTAEGMAALLTRQNEMR